MTLEDIIRFEKEEGIQKGIEIGTKKGIKIGTLNKCAEMLKRAMASGLSIEEAAKALFLSDEELREVLDSGLLKDCTMPKN